jgi:hypothetical protein
VTAGDDKECLFVAGTPIWSPWRDPTFLAAIKAASDAYHAAVEQALAEWEAGHE